MSLLCQQPTQSIRTSGCKWSISEGRISHKRVRGVALRYTEDGLWCTGWKSYNCGASSNEVESSRVQKMDSRRGGICNIGGICPQIQIQHKGKIWNLHGMRPDKERDSVWDGPATISQYKRFSWLLLLLLRAPYWIEGLLSIFREASAWRHWDHTTTSLIRSQVRI